MLYIMQLEIKNEVSGKMIAAGIDMGSTATKAVLFENKILASTVIPTGWNPKEAGVKALEILMKDTGIKREQIHRIIATGYGRISLPFADKKVTEITCHAKGAAFMFPGTRTVIDIGGQDSKVISLGEQGNVINFMMNDKCAAGTGRFLQVMSGLLDMNLDELGEAASKGKLIEINSMCTVFAETEVIGLLAGQVTKEEIAGGIIKSIAKRVQGLIGRIGCREEITFTGGVAQNKEICQLLAEELGISFNIPEKPQIAGALGAAIIAAEQ